jgi:hypothetical protein
VNCVGCDSPFGKLVVYAKRVNDDSGLELSVVPKTQIDPSAPPSSYMCMDGDCLNSFLKVYMIFYGSSDQ